MVANRLVSRRGVLAAGLGSLICEAAPSAVMIVAFGDSTTAPRPGSVDRVCADFLRTELPERGWDAAVINAGVPGDTTERGTVRFERDVLAHEPDVVIIQFGINDAAVDVWRTPPATGPRVPIERYRENLLYFIATLHKCRAKPILMTPNPLRWTSKLRARYGKPPYHPESADGFNVLLRDYAAAVRQVARLAKVALVDVYAAFQNRGASVDNLLLDGMHPNESGHRFVTDLLLESILRMLR